MNRTSNAHPMSDLGCMTMTRNWREPDEERKAPLVRWRFLIALAVVLAMAVLR